MEELKDSRCGFCDRVVSSSLVTPVVEGVTLKTVEIKRCPKCDKPPDR